MEPWHLMLFFFGIGIFAWGMLLGRILTTRSENKRQEERALENRLSKIEDELRDIKLKQTINKTGI